MGRGVRPPRAPEIFVLQTIHVACYVYCSAVNKAGIAAGSIHIPDKTLL